VISVFGAYCYYQPVERKMIDLDSTTKDRAWDRFDLDTITDSLVMRTVSTAVGGNMDPIEDALAWLLTKSEDEIVADVEIAALYDMFFEVEMPVRSAK
jgi:hypothetical protein